MESIRLSYSAISLAFIEGGILGAFYLALLWYSIKLLPKIKRRGLFLFGSAVVRLFVFLFFALFLSQQHAGKFLCIVAGFITVRLILLAIIKNKRRNK